MTGWNFFERFRTRLTLLVLLLILPAFGLVLYGNLAQRRIQRTAIEDGARSLAELAAANEESIINNARQLLGTLTQFPFLVLTTNRQFCEFNFANLLKLSPDYLNFGLIESNGLLFASGVTTNAHPDLSDLSYFRRTSLSGKFSIGDFQIGRLSGKPSLSFGYPALDEHFAFKRVVFSSVKLTKLSEAVAHIHLPEGGAIFVTDRTGTILVHEPEATNLVGVCMTNNPVIQKILKGGPAIFAMAGIDSIPRLHAVTPISDGQCNSMFVCVSIPLSISFAQANHQLITNFALLALVLASVLIASWFYSQRFFLRPVNSLVRAANALAAGDLKARGGSIKGVAELVRLGSAFDEMAQKLEARQMELLEVNDMLKAEIAERERAQRRILEQAEEQRNLERQFLRSQRMESLGALAGGIAHDLNNALAPIIMGSDLLSMGTKEDDERFPVIDLIKVSARRCTQMVKQIVSFAKGSGGPLAAVRIPELITEMKKVVTNTFPKSISVHSRVANELFTTMGDATELHQVLMNLCVNARDAMPQGGQLTLSADNLKLSNEEAQNHKKVQAGSYVVLSVADTGMGMSESTIARIFEPFFTTKTPDKGTGLGLSTVAHIVKSHNGFLEVESRLGHGTTFKVFLPATASGKADQTIAKPVALPSGHGELVLVVDDEQMVLEMAKTTLQNYGYEVLIARNGLEAVEVFKEEPSRIRLVLTDTDMPILNGVEAVNEIHALNPNVPIIIASGIQRSRDVVGIVGEWNGLTLSKPYGVEQLLEAVHSVLKG